MGRTRAVTPSAPRGHSYQVVGDAIMLHFPERALMKHAVAWDVTLAHYVAKSEAQLRAGWQAVADLVEEPARRE